MNNNAIATLTTAIKNMNAKNFTLNVQKNQKKNGTTRMAKNKYYGSWGIVMRGMGVANADTNTMFAKFQCEWLKLKHQFNAIEMEWFWVAYNRSKFTEKTEPNASVRFTKNAAYRLELAQKILDRTLANDIELCEKVRNNLIKRGYSDEYVSLM